jgi:ATP/maltotriose-dependent transcriptional regulator MalT
MNQEGEALFRWSVESLRKSPRVMEENHQRLLAICLAAQGQCSLSRSQESTILLAQESLSILRRFPDGTETIFALKLQEALVHEEAARTQLAQESLYIAKSIKAGWWLPKCILDVGYLAINRGEYAYARCLIEEARTTYRAAGNPAMDVQALLMLHQIATLEQDLPAAQRIARECLTVAQDTGFSAAVWWLHSSMADTALLQEDYATAQIHYRAGLKLCQELNEQRGSAFELSGLGSAAVGMGDYLLAGRYFHDALQIAIKVANRSAVLDVIGGTAWLFASRGDLVRAASLVMYAECQPELETTAKLRIAKLRKQLEGQLSPAFLSTAMNESRRIDLDETIDRLLGELRQVGETVTPIVSHSASDPLTERELEVLKLIAGGLSNYDIALRLFIGVSTVKTHVNRMFSKLSVKNRTQAVACARELHLI